MKVKDYYAILGIMPSAEDVVVQGAYRALARRYHPDVWAGDKAFAEAKMKELNEAYAVLSDKEKRERYDNVRRNNGFEDAHPKSEEAEATPQGPPKSRRSKATGEEMRAGPQRHPTAQPRGHWGSVQRTLALLAALLVVAGALVWLRPQLRDVTEMSPALQPKISNRIEPPTSPVSQDGQRVAISPQLPRPSSVEPVTPNNEPRKIKTLPVRGDQPGGAAAPVTTAKTDRLSPSVWIAPPSLSIAPVTQRVVLYDEDPSDPKGKQYVGSVIWRTEPIKASGNQKADIAVRADIEIPDRKFKMTMSFRRNTDTSLPASHTAELTFILPQDFSGGGVGNVPGILMKSNEQARGTPLAGLAVKVTDGFFLVGLSNVDADRARNLQLLKERSWFDVPLVYANQRRAIIAIEKGAPGERAFNEAFAAWE